MTTQVCGICGSPMLPHLGYFYGAHMDCARQAINLASHGGGPAVEPTPGHEDRPCECGNVSWEDGFDTCLPDGTLIEPLIGSAWAGHYKCVRCDKVEMLVTV
jgi:hypothetical protein